ncbi:MAG: hypothetical protein JWO08_2352 [Verrucomicrobiaceae bacterium]|nr:hypothetical protein [Verrucomicrobiaceae bacterium]
MSLLSIAVRMDLARKRMLSAAEDVEVAGGGLRHQAEQMVPNYALITEGLVQARLAAVAYGQAERELAELLGRMERQRRPVGGELACAAG